MKKSSLTTDKNLCPCGSNNPYPTCCGQFHDVQSLRFAPDPVTLMRSRYSAYVLDLTDYILTTWHPDTRPEYIEGNAPGSKWLGLKIINDRTDNPDSGTVEFVARLRIAGGSSLRLHEVSRFIRANGRWYYVDGVKK